MTHFPFGTVSATTAAYLLEQSLLFDGAAYLSRTPSTAGNRKTWTYSVWFKPGLINGTAKCLFGQPDVAGGISSLFYDNSTARLDFYYHFNGSSWTGHISSTALFRDPSAWYHVVITADATNATSGDRLRMYVNGSRITAFDTETYPTLNQDGGINRASVELTIGAYSAPAGYFNGLMALPILVDGAALDATSFGELDADGYWNPIEFTETARTGDLTPTWRSVYTDTTPTTTSTSGSITTGADTDDWVVVTVEASGGAANAATACTLGGQAMTLVATTDNSAAAVAMFKIASSAISNAATAVVVATWSSAPNRNSINVFSVSGPLGSVYDSFASSTGATISSFSDTMQIPAGGCVIGSTVNNGAANTWSGLTEGSDEFFESTYTSAASAAFASDTVNQTISATFASSTSSGGLFVSFQPQQTVYGRNGGAYDFADSADFGYDVSESGTLTGLSSHSPVSASYINDGSVAFTIGTGTLSRTSAYNAIRSSFVLTGDFSLTANITSGATTARFGVYAANEDSTWDFDEGVYGDGATRSMSKSYYVDFGSANFFAEGSTHSSTAQSTGVVTITRVGSTITLTSVNGAYSYSDASAYTGPMRVMFGGGGDTFSWTSIAWTSDGLRGNSFEPIGFVAADQVSDTPTDDADLGIGNQATLDPNRVQAQATIGNNNRRVTASDVTPAGNCIAATIGGLNSGKWFWYTSLASFAADSGSGIFDGDLDFLSMSPNTGSVNNYGAALDTTTFMRRYAGGSSVPPDVSLGFTADLSNDKAVYALDADNGYFWAGIYDASANTIYWIDNANNDMTGNPTDGGTTGKAISGNNWTPFAWATSSSAAGIDVYFGHEDFPGTIPTDFKEIATQNLPITHPLYAPPPAQLRAGVQIHSVTFASNDSGKENASFRQTYLATDVADQAFTRVRFLLEGHSSSTCQYDNLSTGIHTSGGSTAATPVPITVYGTTVVTLAAGSKVWTDWVELTGTAGQVPVLIADIASTNGNLRRLDGGSNTYYEKASTNSYATADISSAGFSSSTRTYIGSKIEVQ
jgi:hypothetical protein